MPYRKSDTIRIETPIIPTSFADLHKAIAAGPKTYPTHQPFIDSLYDAAFITNQDGIIIDANNRAAQFFSDKDPKALLGFPIYILFAGDANRFMLEIHSHIQTHPFVVLECRAVRFDKSTFESEVAVSKNNELNGSYIFTVRDISTRQDAIRSLKHAIERLQAEDRERMAFVSNASHELRTPLTSMVYAVNNMLSGVCGPVPPKAIAYLERIKADENRLMATINDILDMRQIETNTLTLYKTQVGMNALLYAVVDALSIQTAAKQQKITIKKMAQEYFVYADRQRLERVFFNLINNAIKFTQAGGMICCSLNYDEATQTCHALIDDNGPGIAQEDLPNIAKRYYRVGQHVTGTGLGLAIVKETIELHGGSLIVRSPVPGTSCGSQFEVILKTCPGPSVYLHNASESSRQETLDKLGYTLVETPTEQTKLIIIEDTKPGYTDQINTWLTTPETKAIPIILLCKCVTCECRKMIRSGVEIIERSSSESKLIAAIRKQLNIKS